MKILKGMFYYFLILALILLLAALLAPSSKRIQRSRYIQAPARVIFPLVSQFDLCAEWDPWSALDPDQERGTEGEFGDPDFHLRWLSKHPQVGAGTARITGLAPHQWVEVRLQTGSGWRGWTLQSRIELKEEGNKTLVTWKISSERSFPFRILHHLLEWRLGKLMDQGLDKLDQVSVARNEAGGPEVELSSFRGVSYAMVKGNVPFRRIDAFSAESYPRIFAYIRQHGLQAHSAPRAMYYTWDTERKETDMATAVAISDPGDVQGDSVQIAVGEAQLFADHIAFEMKGPYSQAKAVHEALGQWISTNGKTLLSPPMEEYLKGPYDRVDSADYRTRIIYYFE